MPLDVAVLVGEKVFDVATAFWRNGSGHKIEASGLSCRGFFFSHGMFDGIDSHVMPPRLVKTSVIGDCNTADKIFAENL